MAFTAVITKGEVTKISDVIYNVGLNVTINDGIEDIFQRTYTAKYNTNAASMDPMLGAIRAEFVADWAKFIAENDIHASAGFDAVLAQLQTEANVYINQE